MPADHLSWEHDRGLHLMHTESRKKEACSESPGMGLGRDLRCIRCASITCLQASQRQTMRDKTGDSLFRV